MPSRFEKQLGVTLTYGKISSLRPEEPTSFGDMVIIVIFKEGIHLDLEKKTQNSGTTNQRETGVFITT